MKIIYKIYATIKDKHFDKLNEMMEAFSGEKDYLGIVGSEMAELTAERSEDFTQVEEADFILETVRIFWEHMKEKSSETEFKYYQEKFDIVMRRDRTEI